MLSMQGLRVFYTHKVLSIVRQSLKSLLKMRKPAPNVNSLPWRVLCLVVLGGNAERVLTQRDEVGAGLEKGRGQELELKHKAKA